MGLVFWFSCSFLLELLDARLMKPESILARPLRSKAIRRGSSISSYHACLPPPRSHHLFSIIKYHVLLLVMLLPRTYPFISFLSFPIPFSFPIFLFLSNVCIQTHQQSRKSIEQYHVLVSLLLRLHGGPYPSRLCPLALLILKKKKQQRRHLQD